MSNFRDKATNSRVATVSSIALSGNQTVNGSTIDINDLGVGNAIFVGCTAIGTGANRSIALKLQESDASGSGFTDVSADDQTGTGFGTSVDAVGQGRRVSYLGSKRYFRVVATSTGVTGASNLAVLPVYTPDSTAE